MLLEVWEGGRVLSLPGFKTPRDASRFGKFSISSQRGEPVRHFVTCNETDFKMHRNWFQIQRNGIKCVEEVENNNCVGEFKRYRSNHP